MKLSLLALGLLATKPAFAQKAFIGLSIGASLSKRINNSLPGFKPVVTEAGKLEIGVHGKRSTDFGVQLFATTWRMSSDIIYTDIHAQPIGNSTIKVDFARPALSALLFARKNIGKGKAGFRVALAAGATYAIADENKSRFEIVELLPGQLTPIIHYIQGAPAFGLTVSPQLGYRVQFNNHISGSVDAALLASFMKGKGGPYYTRFNYTMLTVPLTVGAQISL